MKRRSFLKGLVAFAAVPFASKVPAKWEPVLDSTPRMHAGGIVQPGRMFPIDEHGPECFLPLKRGGEAKIRLVIERNSDQIRQILQ